MDAQGAHLPRPAVQPHPAGAKPALRAHDVQCAQNCLPPGHTAFDGGCMQARPRTPAVIATATATVIAFQDMQVGESCCLNCLLVVGLPTQADVSGTCRQVRWVPCGSERSPAAYSWRGRTRSSSATTSATSASVSGPFSIMPAISKAQPWHKGEGQFAWVQPCIGLYSRTLFWK